MRIGSDNLGKSENSSLTSQSSNSLASEAKIRAIMAIWLDYIRLEDLTNAKVDAQRHGVNYVWDKGISLIGNHLIIDKTLFKTLKQEKKAYADRNREEDYQIAVAFPSIAQLENNLRKFRPLFTIDLTPILSVNYRQKGWDLTEFEFHPVLPNIIKFYGIEEEEVERLPTREGLFVFLEAIFNRTFPTLQDFLNLIELPPKPLRCQPVPYLLRFGFANYNHHLKKDFQNLQGQLDYPWSIPGHPAYEYLFGLPQSPKQEQLFLGAWATSPPDEAQATALKHSCSHGLTAVIGPPGHGKTHVVLHKIAQQVVERAVKLAQQGLDENNLTVVASTNNRAVNNVETYLSEQFNNDFFYLSQVGEDRDSLRKKVLPKLQAALNWLNETTFELAEWERTKARLSSAVEEFQSHRERAASEQKLRVSDERQLEHNRAEIEKLTQAIEAIQSEQQQLSSKEESDYSQFPHDTIRRIARVIESAWKTLPTETRQPRSWYQNLGNWLLSLWRFFKGKTDRAIISRLNKSINEDVARTKNTLFPLELIINRKHLEYWRSQIAGQLTAAEEWQQKWSLRKRNHSRLRTLQQQIVSQKRQQQQIQTKIASYSERDFYSCFYTDHHQLQVRLFELSWQFQLQSALRSKEAVIASIRTYIGVLNGEWETKRQFKRNCHSVYRDLSLLFPVFLTTLQSQRRLFPELHNGCIDQTIIDEAGQIPPHQPFPLLVRSRRAMFLGDPWQLEPIVSLSDSDKDLYRAKAFFTRQLTDTDYDRYSPTALSAYHRAAGGSGRVGDLGNGIILKYHYRSVPEIARFISQLCYPEMIIKTLPSPSRLGANLIACHVEGQHIASVNQSEIEAVEVLY
jgi:predicted  nucleic acid-binding Zn-ribbon protein